MKHLEALVIEYVSATGNTAQIVFLNNYPSGVVPFSTQDNTSALSSHQFAAIPAGGKNVFSQQAGLYAAPSSTIAAETQTAANDCVVNISGYSVGVTSLWPGLAARTGKWQSLDQ